MGIPLKEIQQADGNLSLWKVAQKNGYASISYSQISLFTQCPQKWYRMYVLKEKPEVGSIHLIFGSAMHTVLQEYLKTMFEVSAVAADKLDFSKRLYDALVDEFNKSMKNKTEHFTTKQELAEFYTDGLQTLEYFRKHRSAYFSNRNYELVGIELPLLEPLVNNDKMVIMSFLDVVIRDKRDGQVIIYDIKTSTRGWQDYKKKDPSTNAQLLLYKKYYSKMYNVPIEKIKVIFFILKRKIWEESPYPMKRIQVYEPSQGSVSLNRAEALLDNFVNYAFDDNGKIKKDIKYETKRHKLCDWCHLKDTCPEWNK